MKTTKLKPIKKMAVGGVTADECAAKPKKPGCRKVFKSTSKSSETKGGILGTLLGAAAGLGGYAAYKKLREQKKGGTVKSKLIKKEDGGSTTKSFKNPITGRTRVTEGWKENKDAPRETYTKKIDVYGKDANKIKTINKSQELTSKSKYADDGKFFTPGKKNWSFKKNVTKYNKKG